MAEQLRQAMTDDEAREYARATVEHRHTIALTPRWTPMFDHAGQQSLIYHPARFKWVPAGRRSGKTEIIKRDASSELIKQRDWPALIGILAPTFSRCREIYFDDLRALIPEHWVKSIRESLNSMEIVTRWNAKIRLLGMQKPEVVEGVPWDRLYGDEFADYPSDCFELHIRPSLSTPGREGTFWGCGVPDEVGSNQKEYEKYWDIGQRWPERPDHCSFWWPSSDILSEAEIQSMIDDGIDPMRFRQEMRGEFIRSGNKAFPSFNPTKTGHVDPAYTEYCAFLPIDHTLDFGVRPAASLICQTYKDSVWVLDEIVLDDGSTDVAAHAFIERCGQFGYDIQSNKVRVFGDAAGRHPGSNTGESDYVILSQVYRSLNVEFLNLIDPPAIKDTVNSIRTKLQDVRGKMTLFIHPRCKRLIEEMKDAPWPAKLSEYHCLAALRYYIYTLFGQRSGAGVSSFGRANLGKPAPTVMQRISAKYTR